MERDTFRILLKPLLVVAGTLSLVLGIIGIFLPLLPTTPLLLLAAACYARSSRRFYRWLMGNRWFGEYLRNYRNGRGVTLAHKILTLALLWVTIGLTVLLAVSILWVRILLLLIAVGVTVHVLTLRTMEHGGAGTSGRTGSREQR